ncbi:phosphoglucosamine mutase [Dialister sp.]|uniref:phosphoglucosamine mutase n=1 Tax=Dialister sp. TaxID=1955814 RepID=UPI002E7FEAD6|nr:phosphoglucosamine mutase [Dialister sp.]MEE3452589.1 phosphoglucosamine mutase [Dialister sp.]
MVTLFGTDGVRGLVNSTLMPELAYQLGRAAGAYFCKTRGEHRFLIGMDTRISGSMLTAALSAGLCASGVNVDVVGVIPTPGIAYLTRVEGYDAGVVISASHNPFPDNGIKFFDRNGYKLPDATEEEIENILRHDETIARPTGDGIGVIRDVPQLSDKYREFVKSTVKGDFKGLKIVTDSANGAASDFLPGILAGLGAEVIPIFHEPNGVNINNGCGSTHIETLQKKVVEMGADCGIANDGDADRCLFVDEKGQVLDGDHLMVINALKMKEEGRLHDNMVVGTVMSNLGFGKALRAHGCQTVSTQVGDRYVLEEMLKHDYSIGGEQSGHIIFPEFNTTGDGLITAVQTLMVLRDSGKKMSDLNKLMVTYPQILKNVEVYSKNGWEENDLIMDAIRAGENELAGEGRILVRASGTEPLIRVMGEGREPDQLERIVDDIASVIESELGVGNN